jgi:ribosome-associated protein
LISSTALSAEQKELLLIKLKSKLTKDGELILSSQKSRSQNMNKEDVVERFILMIERFSKPSKRRIKTKPTRAAKEKRIKAKKELSEKKIRRKRI